MFGDKNNNLECLNNMGQGANIEADNMDAFLS